MNKNKRSDTFKEFLISGNQSRFMRIKSLCIIKK